MRLEVRYSLRAWQEEIELLDHIMHDFGHDKARKVYKMIE